MDFQGNQVSLCVHRYVQLPINVAMREAWREPWQLLEQHGQPPDSDPQMLPLTAVAARLGVGVFASGPLSEAGVLRDSGLMVGWYTS